MATEPRFGRAAGKLSRSGRDRQRGVPAWATAALPGLQRPAVKSPGRSVKPPAVREIDLDSSERQWCYDLSQLHELVASTLIWSRSMSYGRTCRWEIWPTLFEHAERDIGILDLCRRWLASTFLVPASSPGFDHVAAREAGQSLLDADGLAGLALVHQAVGEGVLPSRPGPSGEIKQHCPGDDAIVVVAEQLLQVLGQLGLAAGRADERGHCRFCGVPGPFGGFARLMDRRVTVLGGGYGGQGVQQPPRCPPDRLGEYRACPAFRPWCQRRPDQQRIQVIEQTEIAPPIERGQRGLSRLGELGGEVGGDAGPGRPGDQGGGLRRGRL